MSKNYYYFEYARIEEDEHAVMFNTVIESKSKEKAKKKAFKKLGKVFEHDEINGKMIGEETDSKDLLNNSFFPKQKWLDKC